MAFHPHSDADEFDYLFKILLIGDANIGKASLINSFKSGPCVEKPASTIGADFAITTLHIDKKVVKLQIWDTAGQERFRTITRSYYGSAHGVIMAYDITKKISFDNVSRWLDDVKQYADANIVQILIGTNRDMEHLREVTYTEAKTFAEHQNMIALLETSSKENTNIDETLLKLAKELIRRYGGEDSLDSSKSTNIHLNSLSVSSNWQCSVT